MDFADGIAGERVGVAVAGAGETADGLLADDLGSLLGLAVDVDAVGAVDLVVGEDPVLEHEPPGAPPLAVVHPLVQDPGDPPAHDLVQLHVAVEVVVVVEVEGSPYETSEVVEGTAAEGGGELGEAAAVVVAVGGGGGGGGVGAHWVRRRRRRRRRRHSGGREGMRRGCGCGGDGDGGGAAEGMHRREGRKEGRRRRGGKWEGENGNVTEAEAEAEAETETGSGVKDENGSRENRGAIGRTW